MANQVGRALIPVPIEIGKDSLFSPASECDGTLVVFVHGFRGKALSTWLAFPDFLDKCAGLWAADLLFYGYDSRPQRMHNMAINLKSNIDKVWFNPTELGPVSVQVVKSRVEWTGWKRLVFVAHSLGAVVVRRALLDCCRYDGGLYDADHWSRRAVQCLFAPAHMGAGILDLIIESSALIKLPLAPAIAIRFPCLRDLKEGSGALTSLQNDYEELPDDTKNLVRASLVVLAENDSVVEPTRFPGDPSPTQINGRGHSDVCKPIKGFVEPVSKVCELWLESRLHDLYKF